MIFTAIGHRLDNENGFRRVHIRWTKDVLGQILI